MRIRDFADKHGMSADSIMSLRCIGTLPDRIFYKVPRDKITHIDESYFTKRWNFNQKVKFDNQALFYLITEHFSISELCRDIELRYGGVANSYSMYFSRTLFSTEQRSTIKLTMLEYKVWKYFKQIDRRLKRRGTNMELILDKRMNE